MKAIVIHGHGGPEVLRYEEIDTPTVGPGEVLVRVRAAGLNHFDHDIREGLSGMEHQMPHILGLEAAGEIAEAGEGVRSFQKGDRVAPTFMLSDGTCSYCTAGFDNLCANGGVLGVTSWGAYAQYVKVPENNLVPLPDNLSYDQAAAAQVTTATAWEMAIVQAKLEPGESVLVNGAAGGIGTSAVQIAKLAGCRVIGSAGSAEKLALARDLGADETINYSEQSLAARVLDLTGGRGVDVVIESVGGDILLQSLEALAVGGRLVTCGAHAGEQVQLDVITFFRKQIAMFGTHGAPKSVIATVFRLIGEEKLQASVQQTFPLAEAAEAHKLMDQRQIRGKVVLNP